MRASSPGSFGEIEPACNTEKDATDQRKGANLIRIDGTSIATELLPRPTLHDLLFPVNFLGESCPKV
jgi:hypothetical protein